ncbi:MAG TPA: biopolymer transporter ExbD [Bacteroidia bacterium]|nr:biopolymer transporter ExbD [Bacteroidia bacterium]
MHLRRHHKEGAEVFTDSLNDIMFFLLLFFIIISTLVYPNVIPLELPSAKSPTLTEAKKVNLTIDAQHNYFVNNLPISFDQLEPALMAETTAKGVNSVNLVLDKSLTVQDLADVLQVGSKLKLKMVLATQYDHGK